MPPPIGLRPSNEHGLGEAADPTLDPQEQDPPAATRFDCVFCTNCGHRNPADANFCSSCGNALATGADATVSFMPEEPNDPGEVEVMVPMSDIQAGTGILVVKRGPDVGTKYVLGADVTRVGRHPESEIFLDDITVSRRHAEFFRDSSAYLVRDVGSLNGTYVNRERIDEVTLTSGDEVQVGKFKLVFLSTGQA
ncbi:MAG: FHA domain-containing protein [Acidimicrobiales bacterium]